MYSGEIVRVKTLRSWRNGKHGLKSRDFHAATGEYFILMMLGKEDSSTPTTLPDLEALMKELGWQRIQQA
jgi:hypothetical protein